MTYLLDTGTVHCLASNLHFSGNGMARDSTMEVSFLLKLMVTIVVPFAQATSVLKRIMRLHKPKPGVVLRCVHGHHEISLNLGDICL
ncbi:hypothetical protein D3C81_2001990 [compost metagenome]